MDSIQDVYRKRKDFVPNKYYFKDDNEVSSAGNEQSKLKKRKRKKKKKKKPSIFEVELQKWTQTDSSVPTDSNSRRIEKQRSYTVQMDMARKNVQKMIPHMFCSKCDEPLLEKYMLPYHPKNGSA